MVAPPLQLLIKKPMPLITFFFNPKFLGSKFAIGLNSCTAALHLSLAVNRFKRKKKVLVPVMTFSATAAAILYNDLEPVFVDINSHNLNLNFEDLNHLLFSINP